MIKPKPDFMRVPFLRAGLSFWSWGLSLILCCFSLTSWGAATNPARQGKKPASQAGTAAEDKQTIVALRGGKLLTVSHGVIENGILVIEDGKITAVGAASRVRIPAEAEVIDVTGMTVYPGLIDSETHLGLTEISAEPSTNDLVESSGEIMPDMHVADAFHAETALIPVARVNGITNAIVAPTDRDTLPGQDALIQLAGRSAREMLLQPDIAMPLDFTGSQRRVGPSFEQNKFPSTRMGLAAELRQTFLDAQEYARKADGYEKKLAAWNADKKGDEPAAPKRDLKMEALQPYLQGKKAVIIAADEASDLETAVRLAQEFHLKFILNHLTHTQRVLDYVASLHAPVIVGPIYNFPKDDERYDAVYRLPAELHQRGVKIAFASYDAHNVRNLPYAAGYAVAFGLPYEEALKALTLNPAEIWGVDDKLGSLDVGKIANVVVANGDPLDVKTEVKRVFIQGREIPMTNRQTQLRDEYMSKP